MKFIDFLLEVKQFFTQREFMVLKRFVLKLQEVTDPELKAGIEENLQDYIFKRAFELMDAAAFEEANELLFILHMLNPYNLNVLLNLAAVAIESENFDIAKAYIKETIKASGADSFFVDWYHTLEKESRTNPFGNSPQVA